MASSGADADLLSVQMADLLSALTTDPLVAQTSYPRKHNDLISVLTVWLLQRIVCVAIGLF